MRTSYPVGHGAFFTEQIELDGGLSFRMVYDCGGIRHDVERQIDEYKKTLDYQKIDLLCISHFDDDHITGISELCKGVSVSRILLPYLYPGIKAYSLLLYAADIIDSDMIMLFTEPDIYSESHGTQIIQVHPNQQDNSEVIVRDSEGIEIEALPNEIDSGVKIMMRGVWTWIPFNYSSGDFTSDIYKDVNDLLHKNGRKDNDFIYIVKNISILKRELKKIYNTRIKKPTACSTTLINVGSMALFSGKLILDAEVKKNAFTFQTIQGEFSNEHKVKTGFIYCGDYDAKSCESYKKISEFIKECESLNLIGGIQIPHHGSPNNYADCLLDGRAFAIINQRSCDIPNTILGLAVVKCVIFCVTEYEESKFMQTITFLTSKDEFESQLSECVKIGKLNLETITEIENLSAPKPLIISEKMLMEKDVKQLLDNDEIIPKGYRINPIITIKDIGKCYIKKNLSDSEQNEILKILIKYV